METRSIQLHSNRQVLVYARHDIFSDGFQTSQGKVRKIGTCCGETVIRICVSSITCQKSFLVEEENFRPSWSEHSDDKMIRVGGPCECSYHPRLNQRQDDLMRCIEQSYHGASETNWISGRCNKRLASIGSHSTLSLRSVTEGRRRTPETGDPGHTQIPGRIFSSRDQGTGLAATLDPFMSRLLQEQSLSGIVLHGNISEMCSSISRICMSQFLYGPAFLLRCGSPAYLQPIRLPPSKCHVPLKGLALSTLLTCA